MTVSNKFFPAVKVQSPLQSVHQAADPTLYAELVGFACASALSLASNPSSR